MKHVQGHVTSCCFSNSATQIDEKAGRIFARGAILLLVMCATCQKSSKLGEHNCGKHATATISGGEARQLAVRL